MMRLAIVVGSVLALAACDKPSADDCRKAIENIQHLQGTDNLGTTTEIEGEVRRCRGGSSREAVACAIKATTLDELHACHFYKTGSGSGSSAGSGAGSAGTVGSGATTTGSASGSAPGSATGSAGSGSAGSAK